MTRHLARFLLTLLAAPSLLSAQVDDEATRETLRGAGAFWVLVEKLSEDAQADGLRDTDIEADIQRVLREAGVGTVSDEEASDATPILYVLVLSDKNSEGVYGFAVSLRVLQEVRLARDTSLLAWATTWETMPIIGTVGAENVQDLRGEVLDALVEFVSAWRAANEAKRQ